MQNNNNYGYGGYGAFGNYGMYGNLKPNYMQPNFYQNPMQPQAQPQMQQQPQQNLKLYDYVNGIEGAKGYQVQPNTMMMLLDSEYYVAYKKTSNNLGQSNVEYFQLVPMTEQQAREFMNPQYKAPTSQNIDTSQFVSRKDFDTLQTQFNTLVQKLESMGLNKKTNPQQKGSE